ncbi:MAG TPA: hypothetical protein VGB17_15780, partial [Pyrinomonadaceae bacterium]
MWGRRRSREPQTISEAALEGRLLARPLSIGETSSTTKGLHRLEIGEGRDGLFYVPSSYALERPPALVLLLHGAGGDASGGLALLEEFAEEA